ncbi:hypothetical protein TNCT_383121 [Trichonephila clavata]|uniref:Uncharacterized protein n=1 Tax=Trichonephila clavata TaxID=2740835 RepID=A0A8X6HP67_TRICU|nr:hypothetical protein TNCT_383121 [Trichonephila clavata]
MKIAEKEVPDCNDIPLLVLSEELTIKEEEIAQLKADVKKLEKKLQTIEKTHTSPKIPEMSNKHNENEVSEAHLDAKEQEVELEAVKNHQVPTQN